MLLYNQFKGNNKIKKNKSEGDKDMKTFEVKITKEVYTKDLGWVVKNEILIIEAENKEYAYFKASAKGTVLFVK